VLVLAHLDKGVIDKIKTICFARWTIRV